MEFAKITGKMEGHKIQVTFRTGESLYAPLTIIGNDVTVPSQEWIDSNKDAFLALVDFEKGMTIAPIILGFYPVKGASSETYNVTERLLAMNYTLIEQLLKAKTNTMIGPQPFMPDTIQVFTDLKKELDEIKKLIQPLNL